MRRLQQAETQNNFARAVQKKRTDLDVNRELQSGFSSNMQMAAKTNAFKGFISSREVTMTKDETQSHMTDRDGLKSSLQRADGSKFPWQSRRESLSQYEKLLRNQAISQTQASRSSISKN